MRVVRHLSLACLIAALAVVATTRLLAITTFEMDVSTAIDRGIEWNANNGAWPAYPAPSSAGDSMGLTMEALLEKRASGDPGDPPQGYSGANGTDQGRLRNAATIILDRVNETTFYSYRDGQFLMALASYAKSGGPDKSVLQPGNVDIQTIKEAMDALTDRVLNYQHTAGVNGSGGPYAVNNRGYWCYQVGDAACDDSSTTQFAAAGLAAAKAFYTSGIVTGDGGPWNDPGRVALIDTALSLVKTAYELNADNDTDYNCSALTTTERGHGYRGHGGLGYANSSMQQTASGIYIQLFGGSNLNTSMIQSYLEWLRNHYRWQDLDSMGQGWPTQSWSYYMWSSFKAMELIRNSLVVPAPGNLGPDVLGTLPAISAPACAFRQENKVPSTQAQPASFGGAAAPVYAAETAGQYFDYAHRIIGLQCYDGGPINGSDGSFTCNGNPGFWGGGQYAHNAYLLLVLQRSVGGACVDSDQDGVCDDDEELDITLNQFTAPGAGKRGVSTVSVTGALYPGGMYIANDLKVYVGTGCKAPDSPFNNGLTMVTVLGDTRRVTFKIPATAALGLNYVWVAGPTFGSTNCSKLTVNP